MTESEYDAQGIRDEYYQKAYSMFEPKQNLINSNAYYAQNGRTEDSQQF